MSICESISGQQYHGMLKWGHDCGGLLKLAPSNKAYPWAESFWFADYDAYYPVDDSSAEINPVLEAKSYDLLAASQIRRLKSSAVGPPFPEAPPVTCDDFFSQLPWELQGKILEGLSTRDALKLRLVSRSFLNLFSNTNS